MTTILPPNRTDIEEALELAAARLDALEVPIPDLWSAERCPVEHLRALAWSVSVDLWDDAWPESWKRAAIAAAVQVHRQKGTLGAVRRALGQLGFEIDVVEWFETGAPPHTFSLDAMGFEVFDAGFQLDAALFDLVSRLIETVKPARAHFEFRVGESYHSAVFARAGVAWRARSSVDHNPDPRTRHAPAGVKISLAAVVRTASVHDLDVLRRVT